MTGTPPRGIRPREHIEPILRGAVHDPVRHGFPQERVGMKVALGTVDVADGKHFVVGSVVSKLIHKAVELAVCVVQ